MAINTSAQEDINNGHLHCRNIPYRLGCVYNLFLKGSGGNEMMGIEVLKGKILTKIEINDYKNEIIFETREKEGTNMISFL